jgi:hypothetical protein
MKNPHGKEPSLPMTAQPRPSARPEGESAGAGIRVGTEADGHSERDALERDVDETSQQAHALGEGDVGDGVRRLGGVPPGGHPDDGEARDPALPRERYRLPRSLVARWAELLGRNRERSAAGTADAGQRARARPLEKLA